MPDLHPEVRPLSFLLGFWRGRGRGEYPTIDPFAYEEQMTFGHVGDAFLVYGQRSWSADDDSPLHLERGFFRIGDDAEVEITLAHPLGLVEIAHGRLVGSALEASTDPGLMGRTRTGLDVTGIRRRYEVDGGTMTYRVDMATDRTPMALHLEGELRRVGPAAPSAM
jgi:THAP4-like, heme-binding beta-barrel domain